MGNSLSSTDNTAILKLDKDAPILNKYINDFFVRQENRLARSNELDKKSNLSGKQAYQLKQFLKNQC